MKVRLGWSAEQPGGVWRKVDVEIEETDLQRIQEEYLSPEDQVTAHDGYVLSYLTAARYLSVSIFSITQMPSEQERFIEYNARFSDRIAQIKARRSEAQ